MLTLQQAREIAEQTVGGYLLEDDACLIIDSATLERPYGWVFFYQSRSYLESGDEIRMLAGNAPLIINKHNGSVTLTGTALPIEHYLSQYESQLASGAA